ncbi:MAG: Mur ligase domain-containing protein, partial [Candidatus Saccharimonas sp.]
MYIYFSGIGGVGLGPLAEVALGAGHIVSGSDTHSSSMTDQLTKAGVSVSFDQSGANLVAVHAAKPIDWLVYTAGLPADHPELVTAKKLKIHISKRDELLNQIINESGQKLLAVAGTHGKTTTTAMLVWTLKQLGYTVSYSIGTAVSFGPSGYFHPSAHFFVYECDEFDRNFLQFHPHLSLITSLDYDHPDTYADQKDYSEAFTKFIDQSDHTIIWQRDALLTGVQTPLSAWRLNDAEVMD